VVVRLRASEADLLEMRLQATNSDVVRCASPVSNVSSDGNELVHVFRSAGPLVREVFNSEAAFEETVYDGALRAVHAIGGVEPKVDVHFHPTFPSEIEWAQFVLRFLDVL